MQEKISDTNDQTTESKEVILAMHDKSEKDHEEKALFEVQVDVQSKQSKKMIPVTKSLNDQYTDKLCSNADDTYFRLFPTTTFLRHVSCRTHQNQETHLF